MHSELVTVSWFESIDDYGRMDGLSRIDRDLPGPVLARSFLPALQATLLDESRKTGAVFVHSHQLRQLQERAELWCIFVFPDRTGVLVRPAPESQ